MAATNEYLELRPVQVKGQRDGGQLQQRHGPVHAALGSEHERDGGQAGGGAEERQQPSLDNPNQEIFLTHAEVRHAGADALRSPGGSATSICGQKTFFFFFLPGRCDDEQRWRNSDRRRANVILNAKSQPQSALLTGGVKYSGDQPLRQL